MFCDIQIGIKSENSSSQKSHDSSGFIHSHKSILKVRAPTFYNHIIEHTDSDLDSLSCNSYLEKSELKDFLK